MDFGFTNDPTAIVGVKVHRNKAWFRPLCYEKGMTNQMIARRLEELGVSRDRPIYADCSEPKSIEEISQENWNVLPSSKGADSVRAGIDKLKEMEVFYVDDPDFSTEVQEYKWALDRNKEPTNAPIDDHNHYMDAARYAVWTDSKQAFIGFA